MEREDFQRARRRLLKAGVYLAPVILNLSDCLRYAWAQGSPRARASVDVPVEVPVDVPVDVPVNVPAEVPVRAGGPRVEALITLRPR